MVYHVLTLFPDMIRGLDNSIIGRAMADGAIEIDAVNIRDFTTEKHGKTDDYPYGGGAGMVMQAQPVYDAYRSIADRCEREKPLRVIHLTPQGKVFNQKMAQELACEEELVFLCGHYEGIDERVIEEIVTDEISIGDYVLTGGELPAMVLMDAIARNVPGVLHNTESAEGDSFSDGLLEYPQYTRPEVWRGKAVPPILLSGNHARVDDWRREQSLIRTAKRRPELLETAAISPKERKLIEKTLAEEAAEGNTQE